VQEAYLKARIVPLFTPTFSNVRFGESVAIDGDLVVVGEPRNESTASGVNGNGHLTDYGESGATYTFERSGGAWVPTAFLEPFFNDKATLSFEHEHFGSSVTVSDTLAVVGSSGEDSNAAGVNGDGTDNTGWDSGAAYGFDLAATCGAFRYGDYVGDVRANLYEQVKPVSGGTVVLEISNFKATGHGMLMISVLPTNFPLFQGTLLVDPSLSIFGPLGFAPLFLHWGENLVTLTLPPGTAGIAFCAQVAMFETSPPLNPAFTNGLQVIVCP
jgi:hypothetical protein